MDLLKLVLYPNQLRTTCFLCFKQPTELYSLNMKFTIVCEYYNSELTLNDVLCYLFPFHDALCNHACTDCANLLIRMYTTIQRNTTKREGLKKIIQKVNEKIKDMKDFSDKKVYFNLRLSDAERIKIDPIPTQLSEEVLNIVTKQIVYSCEKCSMKFSTEKCLQTHKNIAHKNMNQSLVCEFCGKSCKKTSTLQAHLNTHSKKTCPYCFKILKTHSHYKIHIKNHETPTKKERRKVYKYCTACSYKSLNKMSLEAHINKTHLKLRPYICNICQKGFYKRSNLTEHIFTHDNSKSMVCEVCGENFMYKKTLQEHLRLHSNHKPYECEICKEKFVTSGRRSDHFKRKHMEKTVACFLCCKKFSLKKELNAHLKKVHSQSTNVGEQSEQPNVIPSYITDQIVYNM